MGASDALAHLQKQGLRLTIQGDNLIVEPKSALTDEARAMIREHKAELMQRLRRQAVEQGNQVITWRTGSGRTVFIAPSWAVEKYRRPGQAWFTPWEIVELRAMQLDADIELIIDMKELLGTEICGSC